MIFIAVSAINASQVYHHFEEIRYVKILIFLSFLLQYSTDTFHICKAQLISRLTSVLIVEHRHKKGETFFKSIQVK